MDEEGTKLVNGVASDNTYHINISKHDPRCAYANCLREDYREASAICLRVPTRPCKYQCFGFRGVNMSSPHKKVPSFQKKT